MMGEKRKTREQLIEELAESHAEYRLTIDSMTDALHVVNDALQIVLINEKFLEWHKELGLPQDVVGQNLFTVYPFLKDRVRVEYAEVFKTGESLITEEFTRIGERRISTETRKIPIVERGGVTKVITIIRDITERKHMESALRESEEKFRTLAEQSPNMIFIMVGGRAVYVNQRSLDVLGYSREEFYSRAMNLPGLVAPDYLQKTSEAFARYLEGQSVEPFEYALITKDGRRIEALIASRVVDYAGERALLGVITDITALKQAEHALRISEEKYRSFLQNFPGIAYRGALDGTPIFFQGDVERMTGYTEHDFLKGRPKWEEIIDERDRAVVGRRFKPEALVSAEAGLEKEYRIVKKDGQVLWVHQSIKPVRDASGMAIYVQGAIYDITDRKRIAEGRERERRAFRIIADAAIRGEDNRDVCERIVAGLADVLGFEFGTLRLYDDKEKILRLTAATGLSEEVIREKIQDQPIDSPSYVAVHVARTQTAIFAPNAKASEILKPFRKRLDEMNVESVVSWPLLGSGGRLLGVLNLFSSSTREFFEEDRGFFETVAGMLTAVLERR